MRVVVNSPAGTEILICERLKKFGYSQARHIRLYGEEFHLVSNPFPDGGGFAVEGIARSSGQLKKCGSRCRWCKRSGESWIRGNSHIWQPRVCANLRCCFHSQVTRAHLRALFSVCLAIPGKVLQAEEQNGLRVGKVQFGGVVRSVRLDFVPEAGVGDYAMVHVGFAISRVDEEEAERAYDLLREMGALEAELPSSEDGVA